MHRLHYHLHLLGIAALSILLSPLTGLAESGNGNQDQEEVRDVTITGDRLGGFVLPIEPISSELTMTCNIARRWVVDDTQRLLLSGDVNIDLGSYAFYADSAVIWINRLPSSKGLVNQIAIWFPRVSEPTRRAGLGASGRDVLVTASTLGSIRLLPVILEDGAPAALSMVREGEARLSRYLTKISTSPLPNLKTRPHVLIPPVPPAPVLVPGGMIPGSEPISPEETAGTVTLPVPKETSLPIFSPQGLVSFSANEVIIDQKADSVTVLGSVLIDYDSSGSRDEFEKLSLVAKQGVVFLKDGTVSAMREGSGQVNAESIEGIYLEGGVRVTDGEYTLRSSSVYYDLEANKALALDAVFRTYSRLRTSLPIYARAEEMKQISANQWSAEKATLSTSEFFEPHISIGLDKVTITERPTATPDGGQGEPVTWIRGDGLTLKAGPIPFFFWPGFEGTAETSPLLEVSAGWQRFKGGSVGTTWDFFALLGIEPASGVAAELVIDGYSERGPGTGLSLDLTGIAGIPGNGYLNAYGMYDFGGTDRTSGGQDVEIDPEMRGEILGNYRMQLSPDLMLEGQLAYISDQTWIAAWREDDYEKALEYQTSLYLDWSPRNTSLSLLGKSQLNSFLSNGWQLASRPYFVEKLPEIKYARVGDDLWQTATWSSNYSFSRMKLNTTAGNPSTLGIKRQAFASTSETVDIDTLYSDSGYNSDDIMRFHTRQEVSLPLSGEGWNVSPFIFGRFTGYMNGNVQNYQANQGLSSDLDKYRVMAGGGVRADTKFVRVHNEAQSDIFDVNRIRHIIEPNSTLWYGWDSLPNGAYPIYDQQIEGATGGTAAQVGLRQVLQTQRGGPGNWSSVDFLEVDLGAVFNDTTDNFQRTDLYDPVNGTYDRYAWVQSPYPQFYRYEPELSQWGTHGYGSVAWELSSSFTIAGNGLFAWDDRQVVDLTSGTPEFKTMSGLLRGSIGLQVTHNPDTSSYIEYRYLGASDDEILQGGVMYRIGRKYQTTISPQWDLVRNEFRAFNTSLLRTFPDFDLSFNLGYDLIQDETSVGLSLSIPRRGEAGLPTY